MTQIPVNGTSARVLRPLGHLFRQGVIAALALLVPLFAVLFWLTIPSGRWVPVLVVLVVVIIVGLFAAISYFTSTFSIDENGVTERGFFGRKVHVSKSEVASIVEADVYHGNTLDTLPHLFICDDEGRALLRMRGQFWSRENMDTLREEFDVPVHFIGEPLTVGELSRTHPNLVYWFERRPVFRYQP
ncbi:hypothetical protein [Compostimonas suwonensis]|uniref:Uncharacterized protein n=1 Tax=Compostimonas suwonensis TaxID=1048394 RepID=A0A2M9BCF9_9MICO|nr:hypothetical protein [Compostimonas suwonensis]PJJ55639.1 hypothetical protein CLV54_2989 [Compostimonas suwonensis]